jgi:peptide/nickel transport system ATP-binding protein
MLGLEAPDAGIVRLDGRALATIGPRQRARLIQPVFQDPHGSLNPRQTVSVIIRRPLDVHGIGDAASRRARVLDLLAQVGLSPRLFHASPAQLSGGQRQRVAIARALALQPRILLCDEPTSALDVSVQAQILNLLQDLRRQLGLTMILISHDLSVVRHMADRVAVMYLGQVIEDGPATQVFASPGHPYTRALLASALPVQPGAGVPAAPLRPGFADPLARDGGCRFASRCPQAGPICRTMVPLPRPHGQGNAACHKLPVPADAAA